MTRFITGPVRSTTFARAARWAWLPLLLALGGCAQWQALIHPKPKAAPVPPPPAPTPVAAPAAPPAPLHPLAWIVREQLQHGHYDEGERELRRLLEEHPDDRSAQSMLRQLTDDPRKRLGPPVETHVVKPGESYSTLAQHYLGDAGQFVILARYNGSTDPSRLWAGQKLKMPGLHGGASRTRAAAPTKPVAETAAARSQRLQRESLSLLKGGHESEALSRLDTALQADPGLASDNDGASALRQQLVSTCHERAIVLYRDQKLTPAIALWDRVLKIDPGYEPAVAYRARALELQRRLKQL